MKTNLSVKALYAKRVLLSCEQSSKEEGSLSSVQPGTESVRNLSQHLGDVEMSLPQLQACVPDISLDGEITLFCYGDTELFACFVDSTHVVIGCVLKRGLLSPVMTILIK